LKSSFPEIPEHLQVLQVRQVRSPRCLLCRPYPLRSLKARCKREGSHTCNYRNCYAHNLLSPQFKLELSQTSTAMCRSACDIRRLLASDLTPSNIRRVAHKLLLQRIHPISALPPENRHPSARLARPLGARSGHRPRNAKRSSTVDCSYCCQVAEDNFTASNTKISTAAKPKTIPKAMNSHALSVFTGDPLLRCKPTRNNPAPMTAHAAIMMKVM
jgi:hypothetical protein